MRLSEIASMNFGFDAELLGDVLAEVDVEALDLVALRVLEPERRDVVLHADRDLALPPGARPSSCRPRTPASRPCSPSPPSRCPPRRRRSPRPARASARARRCSSHRNAFTHPASSLVMDDLVDELARPLALRVARRTPRAAPPPRSRPSSMKTMRSQTSRAKPISCVTTTIVMPSRARSRMTSRTSRIISGSSADVGSSNSMSFGSMASARAIATRCCWPPERSAGYLRRPSPGCRRARAARARARLGLGLRDVLDLDRAQRDVLEHGHVREEVELLEDHPDLRAQALELLARRAATGAPSKRISPSSIALEAVDAAQHRRLARARRAGDDDRLAARDRRGRCRPARRCRRSSCAPRAARRGPRSPRGATLPHPTSPTSSSRCSSTRR